ncbi:dienelactone hydrolase family protein [Cucumibacter marinus]|uniref:dienelactone hydrolase family protein n=1 Tax=Cucumibacter marinus TaxID=1121252 RepID=UPI0003FB03AF|nr:dienelactone hydrolase family protein [Cucumibacter marinus]
MMQEYETEITTKHGLMPTFAVHPDGEGPFPAILFFMDAPGIREELREMARRLATHGYYVLLPDLYYRLGHVRFDLPRRDDAMSRVIGAALNSIDNERVIEDTAAMLMFVRAQAEVATGPVGAVGFCMSGRYVCAAAHAFPGQFAAVASLYGTKLVTEDQGSPHRLFNPSGTEYYFGFAETDSSAPPETIETVRQALQVSGAPHTVDVYPDTQHGYCFAAGRAYAPAAAEQTWERLFDLFERTTQTGRH